ncbi:hypothetical protein D3C77_29000 [compost metagenome]
MKKIAAVLVAMVLAGCSGEPDSPSWVKGAQMDIEQDIRWDTDGSADCKRLTFSDRWFIMCKSGGKFGGLAYAVTEAANSRGFIAQPATGKAAQAAASFRASPVVGDMVRVDVEALRGAFEAAYR